MHFAPLLTTLSSRAKVIPSHMSNDRTDPPTAEIRPRRATMRDVAREAGVSLKTVSRVVNGEPGVTPLLEHRVTVAIDLLGYQPDDRARFLRYADRQRGTIAHVLDAVIVIVRVD